jgi:VWFA-related protein
VFADSDLQVELSELTKAANRANVSFYTIDPRGLVAGPDIDQDVPMNEWNQYVFKTQASLRLLAELTGGIAVVNQNNFERALQRIDAETSDYYVLGYYTNNPDPTVRTRRIAVNVNREDVTIRHRRRYSLPLPVALQ